MKKLLFLLTLVIAFTGCKKAIYERNCCAESGLFEFFFGGFVTMPNAFTPDGDFKDDVFEPIQFGVVEYTLKVVTDDGTVFEATNQGWDGRVDGGAIDQGIYGYVLDITTDKGDFFTYRGQVCSIPDPANACLEEGGSCFFASQFVPDNGDTGGEYDAVSTPGPVFCDE